jgi:hypothetical protein
MWQLVNNTSFAADKTLIADRNGADMWVVALKCTYTIRPDGATEVAEDQAKIVPAPKHRGDAAKTALLYESDLDYTKTTTDVVLNGSAYAPPGRPVSQIDVAMKVGSLEKVLRVFGDRFWEPGGPFGITLSRPQPFQLMPITYERAFGGTEDNGWEPRNPVGVGFATDPSHLVGKPGPNVEDPRALLVTWKDRPSPAGFGAVARHWLPRVRFAGTYDERWKKERLPLLPEDFDERFFQYAPIDQQAPEFLKGTEQVELRNLTPGGRLTFRLPGEFPVFRTWLAGKIVEHRAKLCSVILEPDIPRVILLWSTSLPCHGKKYSLERTTIMLKRWVRLGEAVYV